MYADGNRGAEPEARQWLAEFASLLDLDEGAEEAELRQAVEMAQRLAVSGPTIQSSLTDGMADPAVADTLQDAVRQIPSVAEELRRRLARSQGAPLARDLDLDELRDRLSEREARAELGVDSEEESPSVVELPASQPNLVGAAFMGLFGVGWTSFTTLHCALMVGGAAKAIGPAAFALLLFYLIFFAVGFGMLYAAWTSLWSEQLTLEGRDLTVTRKFGPWTRVAKHVLDPAKAVRVVRNTGQVKGKNDDSDPQYVIEVTEDKGKKRKLAPATDRALLQRQANRLNACLRAYRELL